MFCIFSVSSDISSDVELLLVLDKGVTFLGSVEIKWGLMLEHINPLLISTDPFFVAVC